jgi:hypothetical protein
LLRAAGFQDSEERALTMSLMKFLSFHVDALLVSIPKRLGERVGSNAKNRRHRRSFLKTNDINRARVFAGLVLASRY